MEFVVGITGASGIPYGIRILEALRDFKVHLVISKSAEKLLEIETDFSLGDVKAMASHVHNNYDFTAPVASGSHLFKGMVIAPCSMKTLSSIANGFSDTLITRAADVCLKEGRTLILVLRETPLSLVQLENMVRAKKAGAHILPASPAFYPRPKNVEEMIDFIAGRTLDILGVEHNLYRRWEG